MRDDVNRDEHALLDKTLAAMGILVITIDYRQSEQHHYPDSVADVNLALRWLRANALKFNGSSQIVGVFGSSSGGHLVLLNSLRPSDARYTVLPMAGAATESTSPDYIILAYPISDPLARRAYAQEVGNNAPVKSTDIYFSRPGSLQEGNPQLILDRHEPVKLSPLLLLQGSADTNGIVKDTNVSPDTLRSCCPLSGDLHTATAGQIITRAFSESAIVLATISASSFVDVRSGSNASFCPCAGDFRYFPINRHSHGSLACLTSARKRLMPCNKFDAVSR